MFLSKHNLCTVSSHPCFTHVLLHQTHLEHRMAGQFFIQLISTWPSLLGYPATTPDKNHKCNMYISLWNKYQKISAPPHSKEDKNL